MLKWSSKIIVWVMLAAFAAVLAWIVAQRTGSGDIYPEYSSLRADPLGTKAFYESIDRLPGRNVNRHLHPLTRLRGSRDVTVLVLGTRSLAPVDAGFFEHLERIARTGGRVVLAINATDSHNAMREEDRINTPELPIKKDDETEKEKQENPVSKGFRGELASLIRSGANRRRSCGTCLGKWRTQIARDAAVVWPLLLREIARRMAGRL